MNTWLEQIYSRNLTNMRTRWLYTAVTSGNNIYQAFYEHTVKSLSKHDVQVTKIRPENSKESLKTPVTQLIYEINL